MEYINDIKKGITKNNIKYEKNIALFSFLKFKE